MQNMLMFFVFSVVLFGISEAKGIVKSVMGDNEKWPEEGKVKYTHYLECDYQHKFPDDPRTYTYDIHCLQFVGKSEKILSINYDNNVFDNYVVTSCELEDVVNSVFPPKQKDSYKDDETDDYDTPNVSYLKYITEEDHCYARKYTYVNEASRAATRYTPEKIECPGNPDWSRHGEAAKFTSCRVPKLPLSKLVTGWSHGRPTWRPRDGEGQKHEKLLQCNFDQFSKLYDLICVKGDDDNEFYAFVEYNGYNLDRFAVKSCKENDIVYGIFPIKETTANEKGHDWIEKIWFSNEHGDCYVREYAEYLTEGPTKEPKKVDCPTYPDQWINPSWGFAGQWSECRGPESVHGPQKGSDHTKEVTEYSKEALMVGAAGKGIVKGVMGDNEPWPEEGKVKYTHYLECAFSHKFPRDGWTYTYDIHCLQNEGQEEKILSINYDNNVFDNFVVSSCELEDVVNSVFPPKQKPKYPPEEADSAGRPIISYLKYKTDEGKCYARKYQYENRKATAAQRFTPEQIECPGNPGWLTHGEVDVFKDCRAAKLPLAKLVKGWISKKPAWTPDDMEGRKHEILLECSFDQFSKLYDLTCVKGDKDNELFLFVSYMEHNLDRFTVTSCEEEGIINGIFPVKETTANPKKSGWPWVQKIWFSDENGDCYKREYPEYYQDKGPTKKAEKIDCPKKPDEWINPSWGFSGQWRECKGPMSLVEREKKKVLERPGEATAHKPETTEEKHDDGGKDVVQQ